MKAVFTTFFSFVIALAMAQPSTYQFDFDTPEQQEEWEHFEIGDEQGIYEWEIQQAGGNNNSPAAAHFYPVGGEETTNDWFVSPALSFSNGGMVDSVWHKYLGFGTPFGIDTVALYLLAGDPNPELADSSLLLHLFTDSTYQNDNVPRKTYDILIPPNEGEWYLAFRYQTVINWLDVVFDDLHISANLTSVEEVNNVSIDIYPNPTSGIVKIDGPLESSAEISLVDLQGRIIRQWFSGQSELDLSDVSRGQYLIQWRTDQHSISKRISVL